MIESRFREKRPKPKTSRPISATKNRSMSGARAAAELYNVLSSHGEPNARDPGFETRLLIKLKYITERLSWSED